MNVLVALTIRRRLRLLAKAGAWRKEGPSASSQFLYGMRGECDKRDFPRSGPERTAESICFDSAVPIGLLFLRASMELAGNVPQQGLLVLSSTRLVKPVHLSPDGWLTARPMMVFPKPVRRLMRRCLGTAETVPLVHKWLATPIGQLDLKSWFYFFQRLESSYMVLISVRRRIFSAPGSPRIAFSSWTASR